MSSMEEGYSTAAGVCRTSFPKSLEAVAVAEPSTLRRVAMSRVWSWCGRTSLGCAKIKSIRKVMRMKYVGIFDRDFAMEERG